MIPLSLVLGALGAAYVVTRKGSESESASDSAVALSPNGELIPVAPAPVAPAPVAPAPTSASTRRRYRRPVVQGDPAATVVVYEDTRPGTYGEIVKHVYETLGGDKSFRVSASVMTRTYEEMQRQATNGALQVVNMRLDILERQGQQTADAISDIVSDMVADAALDIVSSVVSIIPVIGGLINTFIDIGKAAGISSDEDEETARQAKKAENVSSCLKWVVSPEPSGFDGLRPCDILKSSLGTYLHYALRTHPGDVTVKKSTDLPYTLLVAKRALEALGENTSHNPIFRTSQRWNKAEAEVEGRKLQTRATMIARSKGWTEERILNELPLFHVNERDRQLFAMMHDGIMSQWRKGITLANLATDNTVSPLGTGGSELWAPYLDLIVHQFRTRRLSWAGLDIVWRDNDTCFQYVKATRNAVHTLMDLYSSSRYPQYEQAQAETEKELKKGTVATAAYSSIFALTNTPLPTSMLLADMGRKRQKKSP